MAERRARIGLKLGDDRSIFEPLRGLYPVARQSFWNLVEVGNGEGAVGGSSYWPSYSEYDKALSKGWHVAPTNNQDNHKGKWGDSNTCRDVIVTDDFTEAGLYAAMAERRVYSTEDQNLAIYYYLNDTLMGGIIPLEDGQKLDTVRVKASIADPDGEELGKVEVMARTASPSRRSRSPARPMSSTPSCRTPSLTTT